MEEYKFETSEAIHNSVERLEKLSCLSDLSKIGILEVYADSRPACMVRVEKGEEKEIDEVIEELGLTVRGDDDISENSEKFV
jgi:hypothetical protein